MNSEQLDLIQTLQTLQEGIQLFKNGKLGEEEKRRRLDCSAPLQNPKRDKCKARKGK